MKIAEEHKEQIEKMIADIECSKQYDCCEPTSGPLCRVGITTGGRFIECLDKRANTCSFAMSFGNGFFCKCPIRKFIAENYKK